MTVEQHNQCHGANESLIFKLYKAGLVGYDREAKLYFLKENMTNTNEYDHIIQSVIVGHSLVNVISDNTVPLWNDPTPPPLWNNQNPPPTWNPQPGRHNWDLPPYIPPQSTYQPPLDSGYFFAPYIPLTQTPVILDPASFSPRPGLITRYNRRLLQDGARFYGRITIDGSGVTEDIRAEEPEREVNWKKEGF